MVELPAGVKVNLGHVGKKKKNEILDVMHHADEILEFLLQTDKRATVCV